MQAFQVTTKSPQFAGQSAQGADLCGAPYFRGVYETLAAAKAATAGQEQARIWAYEKGVATGGEMLLSRGYV